MTALFDVESKSWWRRHQTVLDEFFQHHRIISPILDEEQQGEGALLLILVDLELYIWNQLPITTKSSESKTIKVI